MWLARHGDHAALYTTVYVIERSLSLDNVFVFLFLFAYFGVPTPQRSRLLVWGIGAALVLRAAAILGGLALIAELEFLVYVLGVILLLLAARMLRGPGAEERAQPGLVAADVRVGLAVAALEVGVRDQAGAAVAGAGDVDRVEAVSVDRGLCARRRS